MRIQSTFSCNKGVWYDIAVNAVFSDEYNETLDSATILIPHVANGDAIKDIQPYNFTKIRDVDNPNFIMYFLVDTFNESPENIALGINQYSITLMSMTKFLEKIQLPNRTINHNIVNGVNVYKTIAQVIDETMQLYCPKIKITTDGTTWHYDYIFNWSNIILDSKLNVPCKDFSLSQPTLRTMLTVLMTQVGYLPKITGLSLSKIDLRADNAVFSISPYEMTKKDRSMSSDSYINTLVNMGEKILDTNNFVYSENIGFRDRDNVFLKQKENLILNTTLPIYSVKKLVMNAYMNGTITFQNMSIPSSTAEYIGIEDVNFTIDSANQSVSVSATVYSGDTYSNGKLYLLKTHGSGYTLVKTINISSFTASSTNWSQTFSSLGTTDFDNAAIYLYETSATATCKNYFASWIGTQSGSSTYKNIYYNFAYDISKLCVENNKRNQLDTNFLAMQNVSSIDELAQYIYGTVKYNIGDTQITGFSQMYSVSQAWWNLSYTYIENIFTQCQKFSTSEHKPFGNAVSDQEFCNIFGGLPIEYAEYFGNLTYNLARYSVEPTIYSPTGSKSYANMFFSIAYQPMNTFNIKYSKDADIPMNIEQLDTQESAISSLDDLASNETDKINRMGNDVVSISQVTDDYTKIQPLNSIIDKHVIFKREISIGANAYYVNYYASKDYVIKNYFTAIQTKYRAYQYASYESSVVRKENTKSFIEIGDTWYNGGDKITFGGNELMLLVGGLINYDTSNALEYAVEYVDSATAYKNDLSVSTFKNNIVFSSQDFDNVSAGIYIQNNTYTEALGGLPQAWYIWSSSFNEEHTLSFIGKIDYIDPNVIYATSAECDLACQNIYKIPKLNSAIANVSEISISKKYYKDVYELLNNTLQIEIYSSSENFIFSSWLIRLSGLIASDYGSVEYFINEGVFYVQDEEISTSGLVSGISSYITIYMQNGIPTIKVIYPTGVSQFTIVVKIGSKYYDVAALKKKGDSSIDYYYCSMNDTKTHKVFENVNGVLCPDKEIQTGMLQRELK